MKIKTTKLRLILDVEFALNGESVKSLKHCLENVIYDAYDNGTLAGETLATVERMNCSVEEIEENKATEKVCKRCGTPLTKSGVCKDETCPYSDKAQDENESQFYIVTTKVWNCEGYCLEKGDRVEVMERRMNVHLVKIYHSSFMTPLWVTETDFNLHCTL